MCTLLYLQSWSPMDLAKNVDVMLPDGWNATDE